MEVQQAPAAGSPRVEQRHSTNDNGSVASSSTSVGKRERNVSDTGSWAHVLAENMGRAFSSKSYVLDCCYTLRRRVVTVEPVIFLYMFATFLYLSLSRQYYLQRYAEVYTVNTSFVWLNTSFCVNTTELEDQVGNFTFNEIQAATSYFVLYTSLANQLPSVISTLLVLGPLSDKLGRRIVIFLVASGQLFSGIVTTFVVHFHLNLNWLFIPNVISGFCGGFAGILSASFAYVADISFGKCRTVRIAILESMIFVSGAIAQGTIGVWLQKTDCEFEPPLWVYCAAYAFIMAYVLLILPASLSKKDRREKAAKYPRGPKMLVQGFRIFFLRLGQSRVKLWMGMIALFVVTLNMVGSQEIGILFLEYGPLRWGALQTGIYQAIAQVSHGMGLIVILPILTCLHFPDALLALTGILFTCGMNFFTGFVRRTWQMYTSAMFSFVASMELLASILANVFYDNLYPKSVEIGLEPGSSYFIMAFLSTIPLLLLIILLLLSCKTRKASVTSFDSQDQKDSDKAPLLQP